jgi:hypothetical protein
MRPGENLAAPILEALQLFEPSTNPETALVAMPETGWTTLVIDPV